MSNPCLTCAFAMWRKTAAGRMHPDGTGRCTWQMPEITLPKSRYYVGHRERSIPQPQGGYIEKEDDRECLTFQQMAPA